MNRLDSKNHLTNEHATYVFSMFKVLSLETYCEIRPRFLLISLQSSCFLYFSAVCLKGVTCVCWPGHTPQFQNSVQRLCLCRTDSFCLSESPDILDMNLGRFP